MLRYRWNLFWVRFRRFPKKEKKNSLKSFSWEHFLDFFERKKCNQNRSKILLAPILMFFINIHLNRSKKFFYLILIGFFWIRFRRFYDFFFRIFFLESFGTYMKKKLSNWSRKKNWFKIKKKMVLGEHCPLSPRFVRGLASHNSGPRPRTLLDWIPLSNWSSGISGYRFWIRFAKTSWSLKSQKLPT